MKESDKYSSAFRRLSKQKDAQLLRSIGSIEKRLAEHIKKANNPDLYVQDWDSRNYWYKTGIVEKWKKEIANFTEELKIAKIIAKERGLM